MHVTLQPLQIYLQMHNLYYLSSITNTIYIAYIIMNINLVKLPILYIYLYSVDVYIKMYEILLNRIYTSPTPS